MTQPPISSHHNERLKAVRALQRARERAASGLFVAEGEDLLAAADLAGWTPVERYCAAGSGLPGREVQPDALARVSALAFGARCLAVYEQRWVAPSPAPPAPPPAGLTVYLHGVADPGNVGTIIRSAHAFGAGTVALGPGSADPYGPKAVRASMGAIFNVAVAHAPDSRALRRPTLALAARHGEPLHEVAREQMRPATLLIGAEREGLPEQLIEDADATAHIPIAAESLNAAMAATLALYELARPA